MIMEKSYRIITDSQQKELRESRSSLFNLYTVSGDIRQYISNYIAPHWHPELELFTLLEGTVQIQAANFSQTLHANEGCFINSEILHSFTGQEQVPCIYHTIVFDASIVGGLPGNVFDTMYVRPLLEQGTPFLPFSLSSETDQQHFFHPFNKAFSAYEEKPYGYEFQIRDSLSDILLYIKEKGGINLQKRIPEVQEERLKQMLTWIDHHLQTEFNVQDIAHAANICTRECQRIFNHYLNYSPMEYVRQQRILLAAKQLTATSLPVTEIACNCGFSSPSYFSKHFKLMVGVSPVEYRRQNH